MVKTEMTEGKRASKVPVHHICAPFVLHCQTGKSLQNLHIFILKLHFIILLLPTQSTNICCCVNIMNENINILLLRDCSCCVSKENHVATPCAT